jgi:hypothetical protein
MPSADARADAIALRLEVDEVDRKNLRVIVHAEQPPAGALVARFYPMRAARAVLNNIYLDKDLGLRSKLCRAAS